MHAASLMPVKVPMDDHLDANTSTDCTWALTPWRIVQSALIGLSHVLAWVDITIVCMDFRYCCLDIYFPSIERPNCIYSTGPEIRCFI